MASRALGRTIRQWGPRVAGAVGQGRGMIFVKVSQRPWEHKQKPRSSDFPGPLRWGTWGALQQVKPEALLRSQISRALQLSQSLCYYLPIYRDSVMEKTWLAPCSACVNSFSVKSSSRFWGHKLCSFQSSGEIVPAMSSDSLWWTLKTTSWRSEADASSTKALLNPISQQRRWACIFPGQKGHL